MRLIACHNGKLQHLAEAALKTSATRGSFKTNLEALDALAPEESFARGAVHELLTDRADGNAHFPAALIAQAVLQSWHGRLAHASSNEMCNLKRMGKGSNPMPRAIIWSDPQSHLYPPALADLGIDLRRLYILRPQSAADENWAIAECLRCKGVGAVIASPQRLSRIEARRLQLAAETGGAVGILLRHTGPGSNIYAAATRWLIQPHPGERTIQRWKIQLLHGHGGRVGSSVFLEHHRETNTLHTTEKLADRQTETQAPPKRATA